jgi:uncharacterized protein (UPF0261 family)
MATLPFGVPEVRVSTMASGNTRFTHRDAMLFPVDLPELLRRSALDNAATRSPVGAVGRLSRPGTEGGDDDVRLNHRA